MFDMTSTLLTAHYLTSVFFKLSLFHSLSLARKISIFMKQRESNNTEKQNQRQTIERRKQRVPQRLVNE